MTISARILLLFIVVSYAAGCIVGTTTNDPNDIPVIVLVCGVGAFAVVAYPFRVKQWWFRLLFAPNVRYEMHCWSNGKDAEPYDEWIEHVVQCRYTAMGTLTGYNKWRVWKWPLFKLENTGRFSRFLVEWVREEIGQRHEVKA